MGYAKWDLQKEVSQAGQIGFGEVKERPFGREALAVCIGLVFNQYLLLLQGLYLSLSQHLLPSALASVCCLSTTSTHPCAASE